MDGETTQVAEQQAPAQSTEQQQVPAQSTEQQQAQANILGTPEKVTVTVPGENATDEEKSAWFKAIGRPDSPEGYEFDKTVPEGCVFDEEAAKEFRKFAFDHGFSKSQASDALKYHAEFMQKMMGQAQAVREQEIESTVAKLKSEWAGKYDAKIGQANHAMEVFGVQETLEKHDLLNDEGIIRMMVRIGESLGESRLVGGSVGQNQSVQARYDALVNDHNSAYWKAEDPNHKSAVAEVVRLTGILGKK